MSTGEEFELSLSKKRHPSRMQYEELKVNSDDRSDLIVTSSRPDDNHITTNQSNDYSNSNTTNTTKLKKAKSHKPKSSKKSKSKSKSNSKSKSKSNAKQKLKASDDSKYRSFDPFPERDINFSRAQTASCLTKTAPLGKLNLNDHQVNSQISDHQNGSSEIISSHHDEEDYKSGMRHQHEDASNLMFPVNPFDHLMPHKNDVGTPNMAWIGADGLVHTPQGGVYAKTTEAVANFRKSLKYDDSWHRTRQRYICLILLIMFLTVTAVVILLIARKVSILNVKLNDSIVWSMDPSCANQTQSPTEPCNVTVSPILNIDIDNKNWVPATINSWSVTHRFLCHSTLNCETGGTKIGEDPITIDDGDSEINRKNSGVVTMNDTGTIFLKSCSQTGQLNEVFCEWRASCFGDNPYGYFMLQLEVIGTLSFALQSTHEIDSTIKLGVNCDTGKAIVCEIDGKNTTNPKTPACN